MRKLLYLIAIFSLSSHAAVYVSSVSLAPATGGVFFTPTANWFSTNIAMASGDLHAQGYRYFGIGTHITGRRDGSYYPDNQNFQMFQGSSVPLQPGDTWASATQRFISQFGASGARVGDYPLNNAYTYEGCAAVAKFNAQIVTGSGAIMYPGSCSAIEFSDNVCSIDAYGLIDHGDMTVDEVNGHRANTSAVVSCLTPAMVKIKVINSTLSLGSGIESKLYIDGTATGDTPSYLNYYISTPRMIEISSVLSALSPQPGTFSGSSLVLVDIQ